MVRLAYDKDTLGSYSDFILPVNAKTVVVATRSPSRNVFGSRSIIITNNGIEFGSGYHLDYLKLSLGLYNNVGIPLFIKGLRI